MTPRPATAVADRDTGPSAKRERIRVHNLCKSFDLENRALRIFEGVSFSIYEGEFVALVGPSGAGKTTILNIVAGLIPATAGEVRVDSAPQQFGHIPLHAGYVFQRDTVFPWRTVSQNIGYGLEIKGVPKVERQSRVNRVIKEARLEGFADAYPLALSGGMRQRVALMRTLIMEPQILLMDEPFGALDTHTKLGMHEFLLDVWERERQTVLFVTHDLSEALTLADRILLLSARPGRIKETFDVGLARPRDPVALRESRTYSELFARIWHSLGEEFATHEPG